MANRQRQAQLAQLSQINQQSQRQGHKGKKPSLVAVAQAVIAGKAAQRQYAH